MKRYDIIYAKKFPRVGTLKDTHAIVTTIEAEDLEDVYQKMQGEVWSPHGEAKQLILSLGLNHTSMSMGDVIYDIEKDEYWMVTWEGFEKLEK